MPMYERDGAQLEAPLKDKARLGKLGWKLQALKEEKKQKKSKSDSKK